MTPVDAPVVRVPRRGRRGAVLAGKSLAAFVSLVVLVGSGVAWATYRDFNSNIATAPDIPTPSDAPPDLDGVAQNILLVGNDSRAGATPAELKALSTQDDGGSANTDTMIVLHVPADGSKATLISFPRDSYVNIPGYGMDRINAAYPNAYETAKEQGASETAAEGAGLVLTSQTISQLTGLRIDHYLQINLLGFYRISNAIGGVDVCLKNAMHPATEYGQSGDGFDSGFEPNGDFVYSYSGINLKKGLNTDVKGTQALAFVRQRHGLPHGDLDRVARQRYFLGAVFRQIGVSTLVNPFKLNRLLDAVSSSLLKDRSLNLVDLATQMQNLASGNIIGATMVTTGDENIDGKDVLGVDPAAVKAQMKALVGAATPNPTPTAPSTPPATVAPGDVTVQVLNGSGVGGAAAAAASKLSTLGMNVVGTGDADPTDVTTVLYPTGQGAQANTVAATVPGATVRVDPSATAVTLVLGADGLTPAGGASPTTASVPPSATGSRAVDDANGRLACID
ncbi:LCP family protein [Jatrophihabitans sp. YIM 134969]